MRSALAVALVAIGGAAVALAQSKEIAPAKDGAKSGTTAAAGASPAKELDPGKEAKLGDLVFRAPLVPGGTDALPLSISVNGVGITPLCAYRAKDATADSWPAWGGYGETLTKVEVGADTTDEDLSHLGRGEKGRRFAGADYYRSATVNACQVGTEDFVIEAVGRMPRSNAYTGIGTYTNSSTASLHISPDPASGVLLYLETANTLTAITASFVAPGAWWHLLCGVDRDYADATYGARCYVNGVNVGNANLSARSASLNSGGKFMIGSADGLYTMDNGGAFAAYALWRSAGLFPGTAANATILDALAADRSARFWGTREEVNGIAPTSLATGQRCAWTPSNKLDCYSATAPIVGADMPPGQGSLGDVSMGGGLLVHAQISQPVLQARSLNTTWTAVGAGTVATSTATPFVDQRQVYKVVDDNGGGEEYIYQDIDITALATGAYLGVCPWAATESGTQTYTVSITEQTGGSCTTTTTHYKPTATTSWALAPNTHTILDGDCTSARITLRPYDVASGAAATGSVTAMVNAFPGLAGFNGCLPVFVDTTTAAITATAGALRYPVTYSAALGGLQVTDASSYIPGRRIFAAQYAAPYADTATSREPNGTVLVIGPSAGYLRTSSFSRLLSGYDAGEKWACSQTSAHTGYVGAMLSVDFTRDLYTTFYNGRTCQSTTADSGLAATAFTYFYAGDYTTPQYIDITGMMIRNVEVYR